jgi:hypothetical protein
MLSYELNGPFYTDTTDTCSKSLSITVFKLNMVMAAWSLFKQKTGVHTRALAVSSALHFGRIVMEMSAVRMRLSVNCSAMGVKVQTRRVTLHDEAHYNEPLGDG